MASLQLDNLVRPHDIVSGQLDGTPGQSDVMPSPDVAGGHLDPPQRLPHGERNAAIPVQCTGERARLGHCLGIAIGEVRWQTAIQQ